MESLSNKKSVNKSKYILYSKFLKVATLFLDDSFAHSWHSLNQLHEVVTWNTFPKVLKEFPHMLRTHWLLFLHSGCKGNKIGNRKNAKGVNTFASHCTHTQYRVQQSAVSSIPLPTLCARQEGRVPRDVILTVRDRSCYNTGPKQKYHIE